MNKFLPAFTLVILFSTKIYAQLDSVYFTSFPCFGAPGITTTINASADSNATYYEWSIDTSVSNINSINFPPAGPGPVQTTTPSVNVLFNGPSQSYVICVTAHSACCTSNTFCDTVWGTPPEPVFSTSNSPIGAPGDSGIYSVDSLDCAGAWHNWTITGDATFIFNINAISTTAAGVTLYFGPNFTTGVLCVQTSTGWGQFSDTICMVITAPVGFNEPYTNFSFVSNHDKIIVEFSSSLTESISARIFDISGKCISNEAVTVNRNQNHFEFSTTHLNPGIYFLELAGAKIQEQFRFAVTK